MRVFVSVIFLTLLAAPAASAAPGDLDPTFAGGAGTERFFPSEETIGLSAVAVQPDGKIVLAGEENPGSVIVVRLLANGEFDPGFGAGGKVTTPFPGGFGEARAVAIQPDGKIVIAGEAKGALNGDFLAARYEADGTPDAGFGGGDGIEIVPVGAGEDRAEDLWLGTGGRIFLTGESRLAPNGVAAGVAVLGPNGKPDPGFSTDGVTTIETTPTEKADEGEGIVEQPDGKILIADSTGNGAGNGFTLVRLLAAGTLDPSFSGDGIVRTVIPPGKPEGADGRSTDLALLPDGRIVAAGYGFDEVGPTMKLDSKFAAVRYLADGEPDITFGGAGTGIFSRQAGEGEDAARAIALAPGGKLVLSGNYDAAPSNSSIAAMRLDPSGLVDPGFGSSGLVLRGVTAPFGEIFEDAALDPEERLVIVSRAFEGGGTTSIVVTRFLGDRQPPGAGAGPGPGPALGQSPNRPPHARMRVVPRTVSPAKLKGFSGTAGDPDGGAVAKVQIALVKLASGGATASAAVGPPTKACLVLKNANARFKTVKPKTGEACPPRWLTAKGTGIWSFKLNADLPAGRYVVYSRAVDAGGLAETSFSRQAGNRFAFRVVSPGR
jgi:uncharacterized delta-60 repeat protein